jgi:hypothetical protein
MQFIADLLAQRESNAREPTKATLNDIALEMAGIRPLWVRVRLTPAGNSRRSPSPSTGFTGLRTDLHPAARPPE